MKTDSVHLCLYKCIRIDNFKYHKKSTIIKQYIPIRFDNFKSALLCTRAADKKSVIFFGVKLSGYQENFFAAQWYSVLIVSVLVKSRVWHFTFYKQDDMHRELTPRARKRKRVLSYCHTNCAVERIYRNALHTFPARTITNTEHYLLFSLALSEVPRYRCLSSRYFAPRTRKRAF